MLNLTWISKEAKMFSASQSLGFLSDSPSPQPLNPILVSVHKVRQAIWHPPSHSLYLFREIVCQSTSSYCEHVCDRRGKASN